MDTASIVAALKEQRNRIDHAMAALEGFLVRLPGGAARQRHRITRNNDGAR